MSNHIKVLITSKPFAANDIPVRARKQDLHDFTQPFTPTISFPESVMPTV